MEYEGCPIVIRQIGSDHFEYITCINNEIYSSNIISRKTLAQRIFFRPYSAKQLSNITNYMIAMASATIDHVKGIDRNIEAAPDTAT